MAVKHADAASDIVEGKLYVVGGYGASADDKLDVMQILDPSEGKWTVGKPCPAKAWGGGAAAIGSSFFYFGGWGAGVSAFKYDTLTGDWIRIKDLPEDYRDSQGHVAIADVSNNQVMIMGSSTGRSAKIETHSYSVEDDEYSRKQDMPSPNAWFAAGLYGGRIFTVGGFSGLFGHNDIFAYDIRADLWTKTNSQLPSEGRYGMIRNPGSINGILPVVDGLDNACFHDYTHFYDMKNGSFVIGPNTLMKRDGVAGGIIDGILYVTGGRNSGLSPKGISFTESLDINGLP